MTTAFTQALEAGNIQPALLYNGEPFITDGQQLYQASMDGFNMSIGRFHAFSDTIRRHDELKLSDGLLSVALETLETMAKRCRAQAALDSEQVMDASMEALLVLDRIKQRRSLGMTVEQVYEIASIFYFTDEEDPGTIDSTLNQQKINAWLKAPNSADIYAFFLTSPMGEYVNLAGLSSRSMLSYLKEVNVEEILDSTRLLLQLRMSGESSALMNTLESRRETLYGYDSLLHALLKTTSTSGQPGNETSSVS